MPYVKNSWTVIDRRVIVVGGLKTIEERDV